MSLNADLTMQDYVSIYTESKNASCNFLLLLLTLVVTSVEKRISCDVGMDLYQICSIPKEQVVTTSGRVGFQVW